MALTRVLGSLAALAAYFLASLLTTKGLSGLFEGGGTTTSSALFVVAGTVAVIGIALGMPRLLSGRRGPIWLAALGVVLQPVAAILLYVIIMLSYGVFCAVTSC